MIRGLIIILGIQWLLLPVPVFSAEQGTISPVQNEAPKEISDEDRMVIEFLSHPKNPFTSAIPLPPLEPVIKIAPAKKTVPAPKTVSKPQYVKLKPIDKASLKLKLNGFVWGGPQPQAILNGRIVAVGDSIKNIKIISITQQGVGILIQGQKFLLTVD